MPQITIEQAAESRASAMKAVRDRPSSRRDSAESHGKPRMRARAKMALRDADSGSGLLHFHGVASATGQPYQMWDMFGPYTELVTPGAFKVTLAQDGLDVPLVLQHDQMRRLARTTNGTLALEESDQGLEVDAPALDPSDLDVAYIAPKLRSGLIDEMSFAFMITAGSWSPDWTEYHIDQVDLQRGDVAIVGYGANPYTSGELRAADLLAHLDDQAARAVYDELGQRFAPAVAPKPRPSITDDDVRLRSIPGLG